jgi:hypothetical protein
MPSASRRSTRLGCNNDPSARGMLGLLDGF